MHAHMHSCTHTHTALTFERIWIKFCSPLLTSWFVFGNEVEHLQPAGCVWLVVGGVGGRGGGGGEGRRRELEGENWMYPVTCWHDALGSVVVAKPSTCGRKWLVTWLLFHRPRFFPMSMFSPPRFTPHPHPQWVNCASSSRHPCWTSLLPELDGVMGIRAGAECVFFYTEFGWKSPDSLWDGLLVMMLLFFPPLPTISLKYSNLDKSASPPSPPLHTHRGTKTKQKTHPTLLPHSPTCVVSHTLHSWNHSDSEDHATVIPSRGLIVKQPVRLRAWQTLYHADWSTESGSFVRPADN